jgi:hypothetical protein
VACQEKNPDNRPMPERLFDVGGRAILTNAAVWSPDSQWIVFDRRSDEAGANFDGTRIDRLHVATGTIETLYESQHGAHCGIATVNPVDGRVAFVRGPEHPTADWSYSASHRETLAVDPHTGVVESLDARDLVPPFTAGALRGGSHVATWDDRGEWVSFTYEDHFVKHRRTVGLMVPHEKRHVGNVPHSGESGARFQRARSHSGTMTSVTGVSLESDIVRAFEDAWVPGERAITFVGAVQGDGFKVNELFRLDYPATFTVAAPSDVDRMPAPPPEFRPRRLTRFIDEPIADDPGLALAPRHWPRADPGGRGVACLLAGGPLAIVAWDGTVTRLPVIVESAFTWHPAGGMLAAVVNRRVSWIDVDTGSVTPVSSPGVRPEACVVSPDGTMIAFVRREGGANRIGVVDCGPLSPGRRGTKSKPTFNPAA